MPSLDEEGKIKIPIECCPVDKEIVKEGQDNCDHDFVKSQDNDKCIHFKCNKCQREICYGIWD